MPQTHGPMPCGIYISRLSEAACSSPARSRVHPAGCRQTWPHHPGLLNWISRNLDQASPGRSKPKAAGLARKPGTPPDCCSATYLFEAAAYIGRVRWRCRMRITPPAACGRQRVRPPSSRWADRGQKPRALSRSIQGNASWPRGKTHSCARSVRANTASLPSMRGPSQTLHSKTTARLAWCPRVITRRSNLTVRPPLEDWRSIAATAWRSAHQLKTWSAASRDQPVQTSLGSRVSGAGPQQFAPALPGKPSRLPGPPPPLSGPRPHPRPIAIGDPSGISHRASARYRRGARAGARSPPALWPHCSNEGAGRDYHPCPGQPPLGPITSAIIAWP